jgi:hypothetical protein
MAYKGVICGVPDEFCSGGKLITTQVLGHKKYHSDRNQAFKCMVKFLLDQGYKQIGNREFINPENGYVRVLTKKSRFGGALRSGKEKTRLMPNQFVNGMITSK